MAMRENSLLRTPDFWHKENSKRCYEKAKEFLPGGVTANIKHFPPYPITMKRGEGAYIVDVDDNRYIDLLMGYGALALGHGHQKIKEAIEEQFQIDGTHLFGTPHEKEVSFAKRLQEHMPSLEKIRYTNSGTEATLLAVRLAYAYTGKKKIAKFEGHYHGGFEEVLYSITPTISEAGPGENPHPVPESSEIEAGTDEDTVILPFNQIEDCKNILRRYKDELAAVIVEPVQGGFIPASRSFMKQLREVTKELGIVLIFDEVKTGFRTGLQGAQGFYNIKPDLTALGKVIGGGFPFGVVGGKDEIMMESSPNKGKDLFDAQTAKQAANKSDVLFHSGTYNGHPMILAAGHATLDVLEHEYHDTEKRTNQFRKALEDMFSAYGYPMITVGTGTIFSVVLTEKERLINYRDFQKTNLQLRKQFDYCMLREGVYTKPLNRYSMATVHGDDVIESILQSTERVLQRGGLSPIRDKE
ncbi:aspartate aminotransferase family protein [Texcoconibacillus texcoconensis]|uniref:Glutamate-1-semialdehyde 2,1-aminomutase n=1 Tax=Texcoconibacillus texcoconensis TaxID=1095777 RepID=A0A840QSQ7_9BACI|nr:aspartate aminotransferase family protein [Texcoconibacillus texcoconensis]MBB5174349.1 glutamate-1-semialdehyde 2,1-aminomutase [Texcoconibacillus texcoconensis]